MNGSLKQDGVSLVEIMVALVAGLILTAGGIQIYAANKQTYRVADASARIQENARFAMEILGRQLRMAGYRQDVTQSTTEAFPVLDGGTLNAAFSTAGQIISGTDGAIDNITIRYLGNDDGTIQTCAGSTASSGQIINQRFFISDTVLKCGSEIFQQDGAQVVGYNAQPLLQGVENIQITYGIDNNGDGTADRYDRSTRVADWNQVVSVRISLLLQSEDNITTAPQPYTFKGATVTPADRRLRRVFTTTVGLRNRLP
ncbi:type IV pilus assembly protein PilW [Methylomarinovum tepidoasis]|uniref:Type IV pilus assembly protein PilW n=1 Tax=Methylomarinovum tepidoasis TaxID=2840183 RepID=A0AAU9CV36_9GAMM|nr:PilW family protein [Methylomarinovum sp. IN45]BCX88540.1 type IV pilus assembly protein PilW [Methylomarinovum sp. IN45]